MSRLVIGVAGQLRNGKDEIADYLQLKLDGHRTAFATGVKTVFCEAFGKDLDWVEKWKVIDEPPPGFNMNVRKILQMIGDGFRKAQDSIWVDRCFADFTFLFGESFNPCPIIISDTRYVNELKRVREAGGINILVYRPGYLNNDPNGSEAMIKPFVQYFLASGGFEGVVHEGHLTAPPELIDVFIRNDGTLEDLYSKIDEIVLPYLEEKYEIATN
jgi:hypothetical protein